MIFLAHSQEATEAHDCKHDVIGQLVENNILDLSNLLASRVPDARTKDCLRADRVGTCSANSHNMTSCVVVEPSRGMSPPGQCSTVRSYQQTLTTACAVA